VACLPIFFTGYRIARWEGALFLAYYGFYVFAQIVLSAQWTDAQRVIVSIAYFVIPLTLVTLAVTSYRALREPRG